jgi:type II secretory pathway component GspD/PulD (secretin)
MNPLKRCGIVALGFVVSLSALCSLGTLCAQEEKKAPTIPAPAYKDLPPAGAAAPDKPKAEAKPGEPPKEPGKTNAKPDEKKDKKAAEPGRPRRKPQEPPNPGELNARPDDDGKLSFSFKGQDWEDVLEWLADVADLNLQMEEVPPGFLSLTTRGRYTVSQVLDLLNSALINKGYTALRSGENLLVVRLEKLDKSLVPRITERELDDRGTFEFVKCFIDLRSLIAESTAEELKPMLSPHAKITALKTTNRLDILETAGNLRRIRDFLSEEQSDRGQQSLMREFKLTHVRATDVVETLNTLLGLKSTKPAAAQPQPGMNPEQMAMMQAQMQAMGGQPGQPPGALQPGGKQEEKVYLAINKRENSIFAHAPPDKMSIIDQAIRAMDMPANRSESLLANLPRLRTYHMSAIDPAALVKVLEELGNLDPQTRLSVDERSKSIIAFATPLDHVTIQAMVNKIDGTGRKFEVIQLRVLDAEMAAGTIEYLMKGDDKQPTNSYNPFFFDFGYYSPRQSRSRQKDPSEELQVDADTERNQLLIRATDVELAEIRQLLVKLGELPEEDRSRRTVRVVPMAPGDTQKLIDRLRTTWPTIAPNPLKVDPQEPPAGSGDGDTTPRATEPKKTGAGRLPRPNEPVRTALAATELARRAPLEVPVVVELTEDDVDARADSPTPRRPAGDTLDDDAARDSQQPNAPTAAQPPPIAITTGPNGLVISSHDTEALDLLEDVLGQIMPNRMTSKLFYLKHSLAKEVAYLLEDIFKEEGSKKPTVASDDYYYYYFRFGPGARDQQKGRSRLSKKKPLKFIPDSVTNTILVQNADPSELVEIERLIEIYDEGVRPDSNSVRVTKKLAFQYTTAKEVAEVIKDVFRDLLSPNDKSMTRGGPQQQQTEQARSMFGNTYIFGDGEKDTARKFKGLLSMGIDERSNTLIVSAPQDLMKIISEIASELDDSARQTRGVVQVLQVGGSIEAGGLQKVLSSVGKSGTNGTTQAGEQPGAKPPQQPNAVPAQPVIPPQ